VNGLQLAKVEQIVAEIANLRFANGSFSSSALKNSVFIEKSGPPGETILELWEQS
jgi:hypothetical protein